MSEPPKVLYQADRRREPGSDGASRFELFKELILSQTDRCEEAIRSNAQAIRALEIQQAATTARLDAQALHIAEIDAGGPRRPTGPIPTGPESDRSALIALIKDYGGWVLLIIAAILYLVEKYGWPG